MDNSKKDYHRGPRNNDHRERRDFKSRNEGDHRTRRDEFKPRREGEFKSKRDDFKPRERRNDDHKPRREGDFKPRYDDRKPRRDGDFKPRFDDRKPRRDGDFKPRYDDRKPRRDEDFKPRRDDFRPRRDGDFKPRHEFTPRDEHRVRTEEVEIKRLGINGEGIGYINKKITFVNGALPGEVVDVEITSDEPKFKEGRVVRVKTPSEHRVEACCNIQNHCLNCPLMIMDDESIMYFKKDIIRDSLRKYTHLEFSRVETHNPNLSDVRTDYVNVVRLPVVLFNDKPRVGIYQRGSKFLTVMDECPLYHPIIRQIIKDLERILEEDNIAVYNDDTRYGVRFVTIRVFNDEALVVLVCGRNALDPRVFDKIQAIDHVKSLYYTVNTSKGQNFSSGRYMKHGGNTNQETTFMNTKYVLTPKTDFPENPSSAVKVVEAVKSLLSEDVKDLFEINCSSGYLSNALTEYNIKAIDYSRYNIQDAAYAAKSNRLTHVDFECGDVPELMEKISRNRNFDAFIIHESKLGMNTHIRENLIKSKVKEFIYISHSASSFAKDVGSLENEYTLKTIIPIDFQTYNEEIVIVAKLVKNEKKRN